MRTITKVVNGKRVLVSCEICSVCGEYSEKIIETGEYIVGYDCGH